MTDISDNAAQPPDATVTLETSTEEKAGLSTISGGCLMVKFKPLNGSTLFVPYSRIEQLELNADSSSLGVYAGRCIIMIKGTALEQAASALQRAAAFSLSVGKAANNPVIIERIDTVHESDSD